MIIRIDSVNYEKNTLEIIDSVNNFSQDEFIYITETLYKAKNGKYILEAQWQLNPEWNKDSIKSGVLTADDLLPLETYRILSDEEATEWLDMAVWNV